MAGKADFKGAGRGQKDWKMLKVAMAAIDRANWGRLLPLAEALRAEPRIDLTIICGGSTVLERFAQPANDIEAASYRVHRVWSEFEGDAPIAKARSLGQTCQDYAAKFQELQPDVLVMIGDRYEALGVACAAATMRIRTVHLQGGEVSGALDERYRHSISKLCEYHIPATARARDNLIRMGERPEAILAVGCPSADLANGINEPIVELHRRWHGYHTYLLVCYHPDTTCGERAGEEMEAVLDALPLRPIKILWPNMDAFSGEVAKRIRQRVSMPGCHWQTIKNLPPLKYAEMLSDAACCVGNSSSFVRDSGFYGVPVVLVGDRQHGRECAENILPCRADAAEIRAAIESQLAHGCYAPSNLYGSPGISARIVEKLLTLEPYGQKRLAYADKAEECMAWE